MITDTLNLANLDNAITFYQLLLSLDAYDRAEVWSQGKWNTLCAWKKAKDNKELIKIDRPEPLIKSTRIAVLYNNTKLYIKKVKAIHIIGKFRKRLAIVLYDTPEPVIERYDTIEQITNEDWAALDYGLEKHPKTNIHNDVNVNKILSSVLHLIEIDATNYDKVPSFIRAYPIFKRLAIQHNQKLIPTLFPLEYSKMIRIDDNE